MTSSKDANDNVTSNFPKHLVEYNPVLTSINSETPKNDVLTQAKTSIGEFKVDIRVLQTIDFLVSILVVSPLVIGQWRGTWMLLEFYGIPWWACFLLGSVLHFIFALFKDFLQEFFDKKREDCFFLKPVILFVGSRVYTWVFGIACISHWKGAWDMMDNYAGIDIGPVLAVSLVSLGMLSAMKTLRNINSSPFYVDVDGLDPGFTFPTMFRTSLRSSMTGMCACVGSRSRSEQASPGTVTRRSTMRGSTAGIADNFKGSKRSHYVLLSVLDTLLATLLIGPAVIAYWRGTWMLMDYYVYPQQQNYSAFISLTIGSLGYLFFTLTQRPITRSFHPDKHRLIFYVVSRVYTIFFAFFCVNTWRGPWKIMDHYAGQEFWSVVAPTVVSVIVLTALRALRNISAPPVSIITDNCEGYFQVPTMFRISGSRETSLYVLDCLFSVLIVGTLVVFNKRKEKLQKMQIQLQQQQKAPLVTTPARKNDGDGKQPSGFVMVNMQQPNSASNHLQVPLMIPMQSLEDAPENMV
ncbi:hypothetical protein C0J52_03878 [Blattella germanica]|nr:hypothetical protein C0J52_03878 [Blattella germanica]